ERRYSHHVWRSVLQPEGIFFEVVWLNGSHAGAAAAHLPHLNMLANAETADPHATHQRLVASECDHINVHFLHIDWDHAGGLRRVQYKNDVMLPADPPDLLDRLHRADDV